MRTTKVTTTGPSALELTLTYPDSVAFMYSRQPLVVTGSQTGPLTVTATLISTQYGRSHAEQRVFHNDRVEFDLSRTLQLLAEDVDEYIARAGNAGEDAALPRLTLVVSYVDTDGQTYVLLRDTLRMVYGTLDQGEIYGEHTQRRLWLNFPQTFNLWMNQHGEFAFLTDDAAFVPDWSKLPETAEVDFLSLVKAAGDEALLAKLRAGVPLRDVGLTWRHRIENGISTDQDYRTVTLVPDCSTKGTYLRWLNRRGELSYWLFENSQIRVTSVSDSSFARFYEGDPATPRYNAFQNPQKSDYREARELVLGAVGLSRDEFEDLCDLVVSPIVERLMLPVPEEDTELGLSLDGGDASADSDIYIQSAADAEEALDGGDATFNATEGRPMLWQRVTVAPGSYSRNIKRATPNRQDIEIVIELPERNTIKL